MTEANTLDESEYRRRIVLRILLGATIALVTNCLCLFVSAGRVDLPMFWFYIAVHLAVIFAFGLPNALRDPDLFTERVESKKREGRNQSRTWEMINRFLPLLFMVVAGLDVGRFHWSDTIPFAVQVSGAFFVALGVAIIAWAMRTNTFFSSIIRIQRDRGQYVISSGPYRFVRHPGYLGMLLRFIASSLILGSWAAVGVASLFLPLYMIRISMEERVLLEKLEGYREYTARVRHRIVPVLW